MAKQLLNDLRSGKVILAIDNPEDMANELLNDLRSGKVFLAIDKPEDMANRVHQFCFFCKFQKDEYGVCLPRVLEEENFFFFFAPPPNLRWLFEVRRL